MVHPRGSTTPEGGNVSLEGGNNHMEGDKIIPWGDFLLGRGGMTTPDGENIFRGRRHALGERQLKPEGSMTQTEGGIVLVEGNITLFKAALKRFKKGFAGAFDACKSFITPVLWLPGTTSKLTGEGEACTRCVPSPSRLWLRP